MPASFSFDIVSEFDRQELVNTVDQALRDIHTRYDLKDTKSDLKLEELQLIISTDTEMSLTAIKDILQSKAVKRKLSLKIFKWGKIEEANQGTVRQIITLQKGLNDELAKEISKFVRTAVPKVQTQIQGELVRVSSKSKDDLQSVMNALREKEYPVPLQFVNYR